MDKDKLRLQRIKSLEQLDINSTYRKFSKDAKIEIRVDNTLYPPHYDWFIDDNGMQCASLCTSLFLGKMSIEECMKDLIQFCDRFMEDGTDSINVKIEFR